MALAQSQPRDTKLEILCERLRALALEKGPHAQLPTVRALCHLLGTTRVTLTEALNLLEAQHVLYRMDRKGIFVSPQIYHKFIHILFDASAVTTASVSPFWSMLWIYFALEVQKRAPEREETCTFQLVMPTPAYMANTVPDDVMQTLRSGRYDGLLTVGFNLYADEWVTDQPVPTVGFAGSGKYTVGLHSDLLIQQAIQVLAQQGCKKIALLLPSPHEPQADIEHLPEYQPFHQALALWNIPFYPELIRWPTFSAQVENQSFRRNQDHGHQMALELFSKPRAEWPDGLLIVDDMLTDGALVALQDLDIRVGRDVKIATHANKGSPILFGRTRHLTLIEFDPAAIVQIMFAMLDTLLAGGTPPVSHVLLAPQIRSTL